MEEWRNGGILVRNSWKKADSLVGLDIGSTSVKLLELSNSDGHHRVEAFGVEPLPPHAIVDRNISDLDSVGEAIRLLAARARPRGRLVAAAVADSNAITKVIEMDASLSDAELESSILADAGRHIPYPLDEVALDFEVQSLSAQHPDRVEVLLAACRREEVEKRDAAIAMGGLEARVLEVESHAVQRACALARPPREDRAWRADETVGVVDVGASATRLYTLAGGRPVHAQEQRFGGRQLTEEVQRRYGVSYADALLATQRAELPEGSREAVLLPFRTALVNEIARSLRLLAASDGGTRVEALVVAGGTAALTGLAEALTDALGIEATIANPFASMSLRPDIEADTFAAHAPALMTAYGLAMRAFDA